MSKYKAAVVQAGSFPDDPLKSAVKTADLIREAAAQGAARLVSDLLIDKDPTEISVTAQTLALSDTERAVRLESLLRIAASRRAAAKEEANGHQQLPA